jgi:hypothetical protein
MQTALRRCALGLAAFAASLSFACGPSEPRTDAEKLARGREIIEKMSAKLAATPSFTVTSTEARDEAKKSSGQVKRVALQRELTVRRPDRLYSKVAGDRSTEVWYDGVGITLVLHNDKIFGQGRTPETLDKTLDAIYERYGIRTPIADYLYSSPAKALLTETTTGGWVGRETLDGKPVDHLAFKDKGVAWEVWIPSEGDPLPQKAVAELSEDPRLRKVEVSFTNWNLAPQIAANRFTPTVPPDYEGVALIQRARVLRNRPPDDAAPAPAATGTQGKKEGGK